MGFKKSFLPVLAVLTLAPSMVLGLGYRNPSLDARGGGLAGAIGVDTKSPSVVYYNPAGISYLNGAEVAFGADFIFPNYTHNSSGTVSETKDTLFVIPNFYWGYKPENLNIGFGVAMNSPYGLGVNWGDTSFAVLDVYKANLNLFNIQPTVSFAFTKYLSLGVGVSINVGTLEFKNKVDTGMLTLSPPTGVTFDARFKGKTAEQILNIGLILKPLDFLTTGVSYKSGKKMFFNGTLTQSNIPPGGTTETIDAKTFLVLPDIITWGVNAQVLKNLSLEFDLDWAKWSRFENQTLYSGAIPLQTYARNWRDSYMCSFGSEWYMYDWLALRLGYTFAQRSIPEATFEPSIADTDRHVVAFGFGIKYKKYLVNLAYNAVISKAFTVSNDVLNPYADYDGTYDAVSHVMSLGLQYSF